MPMYRRKLLRFLACVLVLSGAPVFGQISMAFEYPGVEISPGEAITIGLVVQNRGQTDETLDVSIAEKAQGWVAAIKSAGMTVTGVYLPAGGSKTLSFEAVPPREEKPGVFLFRVKGQLSDGQLRLEKTLTVTVRERRDLTHGTAGIGLAASYPVLRGSSEIFYEFALELENKMEEDGLFDLAARGPEGWEMNFKPAYEPRYISNLQLKAKQSRKLTVEVKPPAGARPGEYPVNVRISSGAAFAVTTLTVVLTGTYDLSATTASGVLSLTALQGKPARISIFIKNTGTAVQNHIGLLSFNPENWVVDFVPDKVDGLEPGDTKQVEVIITPHDKALVGDYAVEIKANGDKVSKPVELRVTVKASSLFGWIGIAIIVAVIGGLALLFRWLGRR
jgi:uncharacterized membrane protein